MAPTKRIVSLCTFVLNNLRQSQRRARYAHGVGVGAPDYNEAARLYTEAAAEGDDPRAQTNLGYMFEHGMWFDFLEVMT